MENFDFRTIKTFEDACEKEGIDVGQLPDTSGVPVEFSLPLIALYKLMVIFKAINNGWRPDWSDRNEYKYFPWYGVLSSGFGFSGSRYDCTLTDTDVGSRLCTDSREKEITRFFRLLPEGLILLDMYSFTLIHCFERV